MKRLSVFLLVLCLVCFSVSAFPKKEASSKGSSESSVEVETTEQLWEQTLESVNSSETEQSETSAALSQLLEDLSSNSRLTKQQLYDLISKLEQIEADIEVLNADSEAKDATIEELAKKANSIKFFANAGGVLGFKDAIPTLGAVANFGMKFGNGMTLGSGVQYQLVTFNEEHKFDLSWNIDKLSITATVGYEW